MKHDEAIMEVENSMPEDHVPSSVCIVGGGSHGALCSFPASFVFTGCIHSRTWGFASPAEHRSTGLSPLCRVGIKADGKDIASGFLCHLCLGPLGWRKLLRMKLNLYLDLDDVCRWEGTVALQSRIAKVQQTICE